MFRRPKKKIIQLPTDFHFTSIFAVRGVSIPNQPQAWHVPLPPTQSKPMIARNMLRRMYSGTNR